MSDKHQEPESSIDLKKRELLGIIIYQDHTVLYGKIELGQRRLNEMKWN